MKRTSWAAAVGAAAFAAVSLQLLNPAPAGAADSVVNYYVTDDCWKYPSSESCADGNGLWLFFHSVTDPTADAPGGNSVFYGSISNYDYDSTVSDGTIYRYHYVFGPGVVNNDGVGKSVKNNAAAAIACGPDSYRVYYNSQYSGPSQFIGYHQLCGITTNLNSTLKNENASQHIA